MIKSNIDFSEGFIDVKLEAIRKFTYKVNLMDLRHLSSCEREFIDCKIHSILNDKNINGIYSNFRIDEYDELSITIIGKRYIHNDAVFYLYNYMDPKDQVAYAYDNIYTDNAKIHNKTGNLFITDVCIDGFVHDAVIHIDGKTFEDDPAAREFANFFIDNFTKTLRLSDNTKVFKIVSDKEVSIGNVIAFTCIPFKYENN